MRRLWTLAILLATSIGAEAQQDAAAQTLSSTPVTKVIALGHLTAFPSGPASAFIRQAEVHDTVQLYLAGKIDQWYGCKDQNGVGFMLNAASVEQAQELVRDLPLVKSSQMEFDFIPSGLLSPLARLARQTPTADATAAK